MFILRFQQKWPMVAAFLLCFLLGVLSLFIFQQVTQEREGEEDWNLIFEDSESHIVMEEIDDIIIVDIKGEVNRPGIYEMSFGERVHDAIAQAGGFTENAEKNALNLAEKCFDEMVIYVPSQFEGEDIGVVLQSENTDGKVRINIASEGELTELPGIGPAKAKAIIHFREENGHFQKIEDVVNVPGIGEKTLENIREYIRVP
ncbi:helix-hairpin-helix domain-containing protein [Evansella cellulosilytica]|uniref:Competence protein ComEA helix-hairpin-helix repeat protein n=1 Tax=Evansella cellulosilytica (strain ATCC 21833 / DSM 2522 / FERM P-1141 / JCM 9156 / N-4) TaxID=649639 RepID=E6TW15_EVAC2|nr:helix-hairpin-helix domain-containing protein [Evansella cellulosilytica]ADU29838.1 competence protein ComEA helix-hairpin-helix repeat protein [Evansella cellulosilytica DSM 2522]